MAGAVLSFALAPLAAAAADPAARMLPAPEQPGIGAEEAEGLLRLHLERVTALQLLRAGFDVIPATAVAEVVGNEASRLAAGPQSTDIAALDVALLAEVSYYIVSLRYLVESGGAIWPADRPEHFYANDALVELAAAQQALLEVIAERADPLPLLSRINRVHAWTEGYRNIPSRFDLFSSRNAIVAAALAAHGSRSAT